MLQHLLAGINAHINLDLGIAAAATSPGPQLPGLRRDVDRINEILTGLSAAMRESLAEVSPWIGVLDRVGGWGDDEMIRFSLSVARSEAWRFATELAPLPADAQAAPIRTRDARVARLAHVVLHPGWLRLPLLVVRSRESNDVARVIWVTTDFGPAEDGNGHPDASSRIHTSLCQGQGASCSNRRRYGSKR